MTSLRNNRVLWLCTPALFVLIVLQGTRMNRSKPDSTVSPPPGVSNEPLPRLLRNPPHMSDQDTILGGMAAEWESLAAGSPETAKSRLLAIGDPDLRALALTAIARGWAKHDPQAVSHWIEQLVLENEQVSAAIGLVPPWTRSNPLDCLDWVSSRSQATLREVGLVELADEWTERSPRQALETFMAMPSESGTERGLHVITAQWALEDPQAALAHLSTLDPDLRRDEFLETALVSLTNKDPDLSWQEATLCKDPARVTHVRAMALEAMAESRPQDALRLAGSPENAPPAWLHAIARGWSTLDESATLAWLATLPDPELGREIRKTLTE